MPSVDDADINLSASEWRTKYNEIADMLAETRAELDDFHITSKELETELESELQRTEKVQQDLKIKVERSERERDDWKAKFMSLQTTHNTTTTSLQRELDKLRQEYQSLKVQLRDLEMGNDDLERNERAVTSSLADVEAKYSRALEEKILLEHELLDKATLEEETQRLKDELRDANVEISILKDQVAAQTKPPATLVAPRQEASTSALSLSLEGTDTEDNLLDTRLPSSDQCSELTNISEFAVDKTPRAQLTFRKPSKRTDFSYPDPSMSTPSPSALARSATLPSFRQSPSIRPPPPFPRPITSRTPSTASHTTTSTSSGTAAPRNKGVQMVSEMRARVKNLEQKIHTRVPRLRMGSVASRGNMPAPVTSPPLTSRNGADRPPSIDEKPSIFARRSSESQKRIEEKPRQKDSTGWVLIMEDSPSPPRPRSNVRPRPVSPSSQSSSTLSSTSPTFTNLKLGGNTPSGLRRPQSRLSSATASSSSVASSASRPSTPTFIPLPTGHLFGQAASSTTLKSTPRTSITAKRSSFGTPGSGTSPSSSALAGRQRPITLPPPPRTPSIAKDTSKESTRDKSLPILPSGHSNVTIRAAKSPSTAPSALPQSRIGRLSGGGTGGAGLPTGRRSVGETDSGLLALSKSQLRPRSSSSAATRP